MKIGLVSERFIDGDTEHNYSVIARCLRQYSGFDLLLFGESFLHGFNSLSWNYATDIKKAVASKSAIFAKIKEEAKIHRTAVGFGYFESASASCKKVCSAGVKAEYNASADLYCSYAVVDKEGRHCYNYRRMSQGWKNYWKTCVKYKEGNNLSLGYIDGKAFLCVLCGDLWDDDILAKVKQALKRNNCDFVIWANYLDYSKNGWEKDLPDYIQRTLGLNLPVFLINSHSKASLGGAVVFNNGEIIAQMNLGNIGILDFEV